MDLFEHIPPAELQPSIRGEAYTWIDKKTQPPNTVLENGWRVRQAPVGYKLTAHTRRPNPVGVEQIEHMMFTDGLASFSVYVEKMSFDKGLKGASQMGAVNAYGIQIGEYQITVVGEVPKATVKRIAKSIEFIPSNARYN